MFPKVYYADLTCSGRIITAAAALILVIQIRNGSVVDETVLIPICKKIMRADALNGIP